MPTVSTYVDVDAGDFDDYELAEEFFNRMNQKSFKEMIIKEFSLEYADLLSDEEAPKPEVDHLGFAEEYYNRKQYEDALVYLERAINWNGLSNMRLVK